MYTNSLQECKLQYNTMRGCLVKEKSRIKKKELELRNRVLGIKTVEEIDIVENIPKEKQKEVEIDEQSYM